MSDNTLNDSSSEQPSGPDWDAFNAATERAETSSSLQEKPEKVTSSFAPDEFQPERKEKPKAKPKPKAKKEPEPEPEPPEPEEPEEEEAEEEEGEDENPFANMSPEREQAYIRARQAMKRAGGWRDEELDALGIDDVLARGQDRQEYIRENQRAWQDSRNADPTTQPKEEPRARREEPQHAVDPRRNGDADTLRPFVDALGLDGATAQQVTRALSDEIDRRAQAIAKRSLDPVLGYIERTELASLREAYRERIPDARQWADVEAKAQSLAKTGDYPTLRDAISDAALLVTGHRPGAQPASASSSQARDNGGRFATERRQSGVPEPPKKAKPRSKAMSPQEREEAIFVAISERDEVAYNRLTGKRFGTQLRS